MIAMKNIDKFFVHLILLLQVNFFDVFNLTDSSISGWIGYGQKRVMLLVVIIYFLSWVVRKHNQTAIKYQFGLTAIAIIVAAFAVAVGTIYAYTQGLYVTATESYYFIIVILYFPLRNAVSRTKDLRYLINMIGDYSIIYSSTKIIQSFLLARGHLVFHLNATIDESTAYLFRYMVLGFTRIPSASDFVFWASIFVLVVAWSMPKLLSQKRVFIYLVTGFSYLVLVGQTRGYILILSGVIGIFAILLVHKHLGNIFTGMLIVVFSYPMTIYLINKVNDLLFSNADRANSISVRFLEAQYYWDQAMLNKWFGIGFVSDKIQPAIVHGALYTYYIDDIGIVGVLGQLGIIGVIMCIIMVLQIVKVGIISQNKLSYWILFGSVLACFTTVSLFDAQRVFFLPACLVIFDFISTYEPLKGDFREAAIL